MFYCVQIVDGTQAIYAYETLASATEAYHYFIYYQMNQKADSILCMIVDADGAVYKVEKIVKE